MMRWWCGRNDIDYTASYLSMNKGLSIRGDDEEEEENESEFEIEDFKKEINLGHLMGSGIGMEFFKSFCVLMRQEKRIQFLIDVGWLVMMEDIEGGGSGNSGGIMSSTGSSTSGGTGMITHSQLVRLAQTIFGYYNLDREREGLLIGISSSTLKKLQGHSDGRGRVKYVRGMFKNAGIEVRKGIENDIVPRFKESLLFRAMYITLKYTSHIEGNEKGKKGGALKIYGMPHVRGLNDDEISELKRRRDVLERIRLGSFESDELDKILEVERQSPSRSKPSLQISIPASSFGSPTAGSLKSPTSPRSPNGHGFGSDPNTPTSPHLGKSRLSVASPLAALLPSGYKRQDSKTQMSSPKITSKLDE